MLPRQGSTVSLRRLLALLTALGLLPLALLGVWGLHLVSDSQEREQQRYLLDLARALSSAVDAELDGAVASLTSMARSPAMAAGDLRGVYDIARAQAAAQPEWLAVILTDADGAVLFRTNSPFGGPAGAIAEPSSLKRAIVLRQPIAGGVMRGKGGRAAFPVRIPVEGARTGDQAGRRYILSAVIRPGRMLRVVERQKVPPSFVIAVIDGGGAIVARSKGQEQVVGTAPHPSLVRLMRDGGWKTWARPARSKASRWSPPSPARATAGRWRSACPPRRWRRLRCRASCSTPRAWRPRCWPAR